MYPAEKLISREREKLIKIGMTAEVLILASKGFAYFNYLCPGLPEHSFIDEIKTSAALNPDNPAFALWRDIELKHLQGVSHLCSARVQKKHRVILITRYVSEIGKLVVFLIVDDPNHQYRLSNIAESYRNKKYQCGSDSHWDAILNADFEEPGMEPRNTPSENKAILTVKAPTLQITDAPMAPIVELEIPATMDVKPIESPSEPELSAMPTLAKKKKKKKKTPLDIGFIENTTLNCGFNEYNNALDFNNFIAKTMFTPNGDKILLDYLDRGMNPNICGKNKASLLTLAVIAGHVKVVEILLNRNASMIYRSLVPVPFSSTLLAFHLKRELVSETDFAIANLLIKKTRENRALDEPVWQEKKATILHVAILQCQVAVVRELCRNGANREALTDSGQTPFKLALEQFKSNNVNKENKNKFKEIMEILLKTTSEYRVVVTHQDRCRAFLNTFSRILQPSAENNLALYDESKGTGSLPLLDGQDTRPVPSIRPTLRDMAARFQKALSDFVDDAMDSSIIDALEAVMPKSTPLSIYGIIHAYYGSFNSNNFFQANQSIPQSIPENAPQDAAEISEPTPF